MVLGGGTLGGEATGEGGAQARMRARGRLLACCAHSTVAVRVEARLAAGDMGRASEGSAPQVLGFCEVVQRGGVSACAGRAWLECRLRGRLRPDALGAPPLTPGTRPRFPLCCEVVQRGGVSLGACAAWACTGWSADYRGRPRPDALGAPPLTPGPRLRFPLYLGSCEVVQREAG